MPETKRDITIGADLGATFSSGAFENLKPKLQFYVTYKNVESLDMAQVEKDASDAEKANALICETLYRQIELSEKQAHQKYIQKLHEDISFRTDSDGNTYPSVTSIINSINPQDFHMSEDELMGYSARGTIGDLVLQHYIETKEWKEPGQIPEAFRHLKIMKAQKVEMQGDLPAFVEKYKVKFTSGHREVFNHKHKYAGEPDAFGIINDDTLTTLFDLKWFNPNAEGKIRVMKQMAAYAKACEGIDQLCVIPINGKNQCGYSRPIFADRKKIDLYFKLFLDDRAEFEKTFRV